MKCMDCDYDSSVDKPRPCPAHPVEEFLGYLQGEGLSYRRAGQHSFRSRILTIQEVTADCLRIFNENWAKERAEKSIQRNQT